MKNGDVFRGEYKKDQMIGHRISKKKMEDVIEEIIPFKNGNKFTVYKDGQKIRKGTIKSKDEVEFEELKENEYLNDKNESDWENLIKNLKNKFIKFNLK